MPDDHGADAQAIAVVADLTARRLHVATAESLTGGLIAAALIAVPGASACVLGGLVTYSDEMKHRLLGVEAAVLARDSAVSAPVARAMAEGARQRLGADLAVSATGYAGPEGGPGGPPGLVWLGVATEAGATARMYRFTGDRAAVRQASVAAALELMAEHLGLG